MVAETSSPNSNAAKDLQGSFLALVPKIEKRARIAFEYVRCANLKADKVAETVALAWKLFVRLHERGKDVAAFPIVFAVFAARAVACGRRLVGAEPAGDVMSKAAQRKHGFALTLFSHFNVMPIAEIMGDSYAQRTSAEFEVRLAENTQTPVPDQAAFRIDFPEWLRTLSSRERSMAEAMMREERTNDLSQTFGVSAGRISQVRNMLRTSWTRFCGDEA